MRNEKDIQAEINHILSLEKSNIEEMMDIINTGEGLAYLGTCINKANEFLYYRIALEWVLSEDEF